MTNRIPALIVGAGPSGLTAAVCLQRHGVAFRIIDKQIKPVTTSNAIVIQTRTLEAWDDLGLLPYALNHGNIIHEFTINADKKNIVSVNLNLLDSPHPFILGLAQSQTEKMMHDCLQEKNIYIEMEVELIDIVEQVDGVLATLRHKDGTIETVLTDWLLACDGGHSLIRDKLQLAFDGKKLPQHFIVADVVCPTDIAKQDICLHLSAKGPLIVARYNKKNIR